MFEDYGALAPLREAAELLARARVAAAVRRGRACARTRSRAAAAIYAEDMYVERAFSEETAALIRGLRPWVTNEYEHNGLRKDERVLARLIDLARGRVYASGGRLISRAPRPRVTKLNVQRMSTSRRFWKPIRYQRWTKSQVEPGEEAAELEALDVGDRGARGRSWRGCPCRGSGTARVSRGLRGGRGRPSRRSGPAASRPARRPGSDRLAVAPRTRTMSPSANTSGWPGQREVGLDGDAAGAVASRRRSARRAAPRGSRR